MSLDSLQGARRLITTVNPPGLAGATAARGPAGHPCGVHGGCVGYLYGSLSAQEALSYLGVKCMHFHFAFMKGTWRGTDWL